MPRRWTKLDLSATQNPPVYLDNADECYYAREYISRGRWDASEANQLISNFKKKPSTRGTWQWAHRNDAVRRFARELRVLLPEGFFVACIPTSKTPDHAEYDERFEDLFVDLKAMRPDLFFEKPILCRSSHQSAHTGGDRHPDKIYELLKWAGFRSVPTVIGLIDDLLTTGGHFKACQRLILEHHPQVRVIGIFWAKCIWPDPILEE